MPADAPACPAVSLAATPRWSPTVERDIRERAIFGAGKFDPQVFDVPALAPFCLRLAPSTWNALARQAEAAWQELMRAESELLAQPKVWSALGVPRRLRPLLRGAADTPGTPVRFCRMDFHPTAAGWRVSEVNADVPGGFLEAGDLTRHIALHAPGMQAPPNPAAALAAALAEALKETGERGDLALVHATSYTDDQQVMRSIGRKLDALGVAWAFAAPNHVSARAGESGCRLTTTGRRIGGVVRFFPAEWLTNFPRRSRCARDLTFGIPIQANPVSAVLLQSKRLPLVLERCGLNAPVWSSMLPAVRAISWRALAPILIPDGTALKPSWGRVGEGVCIPGVTPRAALRRGVRAARRSPRRWILQDRFESRPVECEGGPVHACLGVFVIQGVAAGVYGRIAARPLIDARAQDIAVLLDPSLDAVQPEEVLDAA